MNNYYVIEIQTNADGTSGIQSFGFEDKGECEGKFLSLRESARQSKVLIHTVIFIDNRGVHQEEPKVYIHPVEQNPQGEPQTPAE